MLEVFSWAFEVLTRSLENFRRPFEALRKSLEYFGKPFEDFFQEAFQKETIYAGRIIRNTVREKISLSELKRKLRLVHYLPVDGESG